MMHAFMQLNDGTEIVHSDILYDEEGKEYVKVYMEKPIMQGFKSAYCILPAYNWQNIEGFDELGGSIEGYHKIYRTSYYSVCSSRRLGKCRKFLRLQDI